MCSSDLLRSYFGSARSPPDALLGTTCSMLPESTIQWLNQLWIATILRDSPWMLPTVESIHMTCYSILFGSVLARNLRAFGWGLRETGGIDIGRQLRSWMLSALAGSIVTGLLLFLYEPGRFTKIDYFPFKIGLVLLAPLFEFVVRDKLRASPASEKGAASASTLLWLGLALAGLMVSLS